MSPLNFNTLSWNPTIPPSPVALNEAVTRSKDGYHTAWDEWASNTPPGNKECRDIAVEILRECLAKEYTTLDLKRLGLSSLPLLPAHIKILNVVNNELSELPDLPTGLEVLYASSNLLSSLPCLPQTIHTLSVMDCQLRSIPSLPPQITMMAVDRNQLNELPEIPATLRVLSASHNRLTSLPESLSGLFNGTLIFHDNPFTPTTVRALQNMIASAEYQQLRIFFSQDSIDARPLIVSVQDWFSDEHKAEIKNKYAAINGEANAPVFSKFLDHLKHTVSAHSLLEFNNQVAEWLIRLADSPQLRELSFAVALEATTSCEDRVALNWNEMQKAELLYQVETGGYDAKVPELIAIAREMFRLERLEEIARERLSGLKFKEELEVYLGFQTALREALKLTVLTPKMQFFGCAQITKEELAWAESSVKKTENNEFSAWFAQWAPWHVVLARIAAEPMAKAVQQRELECEINFPLQLKRELDERKLADDDDAARQLGQQIMERINQAAFEPLTINELKKLKLDPLLSPLWK